MKNRLFLILFLFSFLYHGVDTLKNMMYKLNGLRFKNSTWLKLIFDSFVVEIFFGVLLILFQIFITKKLFRKSFNWLRFFAIHVLFSVVSLFVVYLLYDAYILSVNGIPSNYTIKGHLIGLMGYVNVHFLIYFSNVFIIYTFYHRKEISTIELNRSNLREQLVKAKINILKYQLHPHFFFNTLNTITNLIDVDARLAQKTLVNFSGLLRDILFLKNVNLIPLEKELTILNKYLDILSIRFSDDLTIAITLEEGLGHVKIPSLILQPIIENAITHGYSKEHIALRVEIRIVKENNNLLCEVVNNGKPLTNNEVQYGNGLQNTVDRLSLIYDTEYQFSLKNLPGESGVVTKLNIPLIYMRGEGVIA